MNLFLLVWDVFSFVFWKNPRPEKKTFRDYLTFSSMNFSCDFSSHFNLIFYLIFKFKKCRKMAHCAQCVLFQSSSVLWSGVNCRITKGSSCPFVSSIMSPLSQPAELGQQPHTSTVGYQTQE